MSALVTAYILNAALLLLHEIESAYEKEWEILRLPGRITGFLLLHVPVILLLFYGLLAIDDGTRAGLIIGCLTGACGLLPLVIHKGLVRRKDRFDRTISAVLMGANALCGAGVLVLSLRGLSG